MKTTTNQQGIIHLGSLLIFAFVTAAIGYTAFRVFAATPEQASQTSSTTKVEVAKPMESDIAAIQAAEKQTTLGTVTAKFTQMNPSYWPNGQSVGYVGLNVDQTKVKDVSKVEWYLNSISKSNLMYTQTKPVVANLYQYSWKISTLPTGYYRWIVKVYDTNGNFRLAISAPRVPYVDMFVNNDTPGKVSGRFVQNNMSIWVPTQGTAYVGLNVSQANETSKVEWYLNTISESSLKYTQTRPSVGTLYQYDWPLANYPAGTYRWLAKVYDKSGNYQLVTNNLSYPYVDMVVQK